MQPHTASKDLLGERLTNTSPFCLKQRPRKLLMALTSGFAFLPQQPVAAAQSPSLLQPRSAATNMRTPVCETRYPFCTFGKVDSEVRRPPLSVSQAPLTARSPAAEAGALPRGGGLRRPQGTPRSSRTSTPTSHNLS